SMAAIVKPNPAAHRRRRARTHEAKREAGPDAPSCAWCPRPVRMHAGPATLHPGTGRSRTERGRISIRPRRSDMDLDAYLDAARAFDEGFRARWEPVGPAPP